MSAVSTAADLAARALRHLEAEGALRLVDGEFARLLHVRLGADPQVALAGALAMRAVAMGHSGFVLDHAEQLLDTLAVSATLPDIADWRAALRASTHVAQHAVDTHNALLVFEHGRISLCRYARYEQDLAERLYQRAAVDAIHNLSHHSPLNQNQDKDAGRVSDAVIAPSLRRLFALDQLTLDRTLTADPAMDRQARAAWLALHRRLLLLTGGPGTGKTTTVARLLALQIDAARVRGRALPRIALAAPTGRAAVRLGEAIDTQIARDIDAGRLDAALAASIPRQALTLHRLLGWQPGRIAFRHDAQHPLPFDLIVVDEASMIDLPLMAKLVAAVAADARLILLGDPDQLPAVEAGDVLGGLCAASGEGIVMPASTDADHAADSSADNAINITTNITTDIGADIGADISGDKIATAYDAPLAGCRVHLVRGWRQANAAALQRLSQAVQRGDDAAVMSQLDSGDTALQWRHGDPASLAEWMRSAALPVFAAVRDADSPEHALRLARRMRLLTALRRGPFGAEYWNAWCATELGVRGERAQMHGRLIAITANSERHRLYNGDLGVVWRDTHDQPAVWFESAGRWRAWRLAQLPAHASAFATTVHKAQGSEFESIALILPDRDARALSRELLYTALTRARGEVLLWAPPAVLAQTLARRTRRDSGLLLRLRALHASAQHPRTSDAHAAGMRTDIVSGHRVTMQTPTGSDPL